MLDFSQGAGQESPTSLIPKGQLAWVIVHFRGVKASQSGGEYLDLELTIDDGQPYARKKIWEMVGNPFHQGNSEAYRNMGMIAITRMLEAGNNAGPHNPAGYQISSFDQLDGLRVGIKIGVDAGKGNYQDKNRVAEWLTPNPESKSGNKDWNRLMSGDHGGQPPSAATQLGAPVASFAQPAPQPAPQQPAAAPSAPGWLRA